MSLSATQTVTISADTVAAAAVLGSMLGWLPYLAAGVGVVWYLLQIWESRTAQTLLTRWRKRRKERHLAGLHTQVERAIRQRALLQAKLDALTKEDE